VLLLLALLLLLGAAVRLAGLVAATGLVGLAGLEAATVSATGCHFIFKVAILIGGQAGVKVDERGCSAGYLCTMTTSAPLRILLLDTETNGLPKNRFAPISEPGNWPAILQLSWTEFTVVPAAGAGGTTTLRQEFTRNIGLTLHPSIPWDAGAAAIHGVSEAEARRGTPPAKAFQEFAEALRRCTVVVAHNMSFDKPVIRAAAYAESSRGGDASLRSIWPSAGEIQELCTMQETRNIVRIPSPYDPTSGKFKVPKLNELYTWLFGHPYDISGATLHSSISDTHCLEQCVCMMLRREIMRIIDGRLSVFAVPGAP
jgi:DNA polymerase III epsilon subunit-like protein